jgi:hypothetical protein
MTRGLVFVRATTHSHLASTCTRRAALATTLRRLTGPFEDCFNLCTAVYDTLTTFLLTCRPAVRFETHILTGPKRKHIALIIACTINNNLISFHSCSHCHFSHIIRFPVPFNIQSRSRPLEFKLANYLLSSSEAALSYANQPNPSSKRPNQLTSSLDLGCSNPSAILSSGI